jgi:coenzyme F420 hydrogenase subunit beta
LGLFCFESFDYEGLKERTKREFGVDLDKADKTQITRGKYIVTVDGEDYSCDVRAFEDVVSEGCPFCDDFVSRLADISIGSVGSADGYSTVIVRSEVGKRLLDATEFVQAEVAKKEIVKLVRFKKKRADKNCAVILDGLAT